MRIPIVQYQKQEARRNANIWDNIFENFDDIEYDELDAYLKKFEEDIPSVDNLQATFGWNGAIPQPLPQLAPLSSTSRSAVLTLPVHQPSPGLVDRSALTRKTQSTDASSRRVPAVPILQESNRLNVDSTAIGHIVPSDLSSGHGDFNLLRFDTAMSMQYAAIENELSEVSSLESSTKKPRARVDDEENEENIVVD